MVVYGLNGSDHPKVVALDRQPPPPGVPPGVVAFTTCGQCHGPTGGGTSAPPLGRQSQLADPELLKQFLATVPPPMPRLYPGLLTDNDVKLIADYLKTSVFMCGTSDEKQSCAPPGKPSSGGTKAWQAIYTDLTSPRCINCHPVASPKLDGYAWNPMTNAAYPRDYPRQGTIATRIIMPCCAAITLIFRLPKAPELFNPERDRPMSAAQIATGP